MAEEMKTLVCPGPPEHEFQIPKGRGRPPRYCEEHKPNGKQEESKLSETPAPRKRPSPQTGEGKSETPRPSPRRAPRVQAQEKTWADEPTPTKNGSSDDPPRDAAIRRLPPPGKPDTQSRAKAESAGNHAERQQTDTDQSWPRGIEGRPMAKIEFSASELIPTGQYANVSVGPARITTFVDLDREVDEGESFFEPRERANLVKAANELAEMVEGEVVAIQRNIVLDSIQEQLSENGK